MLSKIKYSGFLSFISSLTWQTGENYTKLREYLFTKAGIVSLINLPFDVFKNAYVDTDIYILSPKTTIEYRIFRIHKKAKVANLNGINFTSVLREI